MKLTDQNLLSDMVQWKDEARSMTPRPGLFGRLHDEWHFVVGAFARRGRQMLDIVPLFLGHIFLFSVFEF